MSLKEDLFFFFSLFQELYLKEMSECTVQVYRSIRKLKNFKGFESLEKFCVMIRVALLASCGICLQSVMKRFIAYSSNTFIKDFSTYSRTIGERSRIT